VPCSNKASTKLVTSPASATFGNYKYAELYFKQVQCLPSTTGRSPSTCTSSKSWRQFKDQQDADNRATAQQKREALSAEKVRLPALSPEEKKVHNKAVRTARASAKTLHKAVEQVVAVDGDDNARVGKNVDTNVREDLENDKRINFNDESVEGDSSNDISGEDGIQWDFLDGLVMSFEI